MVVDHFYFIYSSLWPFANLFFNIAQLGLLLAIFHIVRSGLQRHSKMDNNELGEGKEND